MVKYGNNLKDINSRFIDIGPTLCYNVKYAKAYKAQALARWGCSQLERYLRMEKEND